MNTTIEALCTRHLHREAVMLDADRWDDWLATVSRDVDYRVVAQCLRWEDGVGRWSAGPELIRDDFLTLEIRVRRIETKTAWAENPRTRTRRVVGNVLVEPVGANGGAPTANGEARLVAAQSTMILVRYTTDRQELVTCDRHDTFAVGPDEDSLQLKARRVVVDGEPLGMRNLSMIL